MEAIVNRILKNNLNELRGLTIEGEIPVKEELLNELIQVYLESSGNSPDTLSASTSSKATGIDFMQILESLDKKEVKIELKEKIAVIKISARKF